MQKMSKRRDFHFHYRCAALNLHHLIFAVDLMLFSWGDVQSTTLLKRALNAFAVTFGLEASQATTTVYFGNVSSEIQERILQVTRFQRVSSLLSTQGSLLHPRGSLSVIVMCWLIRF